MNRREMLAALGMAGLAGCAAGRPTGPVSPTIVRSAGGSTHFFDVRSFGATGGGVQLDTPAINEAVQAAASAGGGMVYVSPGVYLCGTVVLKSNVTLYLEAGAVLLGSTRPQDYALNPGPPEAGDANQRHLIFARDAVNVTLAGPGTIDGQGASFWKIKKRAATEPWGDLAIFDFDIRTARRPSPMLEFYNCQSLRIYDVRLANASGWTLRPVQCRDVFIDGIVIRNAVYGPNSDGIDVTCCQDVFISNCSITTGDDGICLKSESPYGGEIRPNKNITINNCQLSGCCNGLKFGTASFGGFENIVFSNCVIFNDDDLPINQRQMSGVSIEVVDGGHVDGVLISNVKMTNVRAPIFIRRGNRTPATDGAGNYLRGIMIENVHASGSIMTSSISGLPGMPVEDVTLSNVRIDTVEAGTAQQASRRDVPEEADTYPEAKMFGHLPAHGLYVRHASGIRLRGVEFRSDLAEARPALVCDDVTDIDVSHLVAAAPLGGAPVIGLIDTATATITNCRAPGNTDVYLAVQGERSVDISLIGNDFHDARRAFDAPANTVRRAGNIEPQG